MTRFEAAMDLAATFTIFVISYATLAAVVYAFI